MKEKRWLGTQKYELHCFYCGGFPVAEALMAQEPAKHTRRHRQLEKVVRVCMETLDCYPGEIDAAYMDHAAKVFDTLQAQTIEGPSVQGFPEN